MAKFELQLPTGLMQDFQKLHDNANELFGEMTKEGAKVVAENMKSKAPDEIKPFVKISKTYNTPSDDGINTKAYVSGYMPFSNPNRQYFSRGNGGRSGKQYKTTKGVPVDFVAILYEYGRSTAPFPKHPFLRSSFKQKQIEDAMLKRQNKIMDDWFGARDFINNFR